MGECQGRLRLARKSVRGRWAVSADRTAIPCEEDCFMNALRRILAITTIISLICFASAGQVVAKSATDKDSTTKKETVTKKSSSKKAKSSSTATKKKNKASSKKKLSGKININKADVESLTQLPGIGPVTAKEIVAYRKKHGSFKSVDDLLQVKGIGPKTLQKIKKNISLK